MNDDYIAAFEAGAALRFPEEVFGNMPQALLKKASDEMDRIPGLKDKIAKE